MTEKSLLKQQCKDIFAILMTGTQTETKEAKQKFEKLWHGDSKSFSKAAPVALEYLSKFDQIKNHTNQAAFVSGLRLFYLVLADDHFETLKDFILKVIQHPKGNVREAARKTGDWLYMSLTARIRPFLFGDEKLTDKQKIAEEEAKEQYRAYVNEIESLIEKYDDGSERGIYIDDMKPSIHKSLQILLAEATHSRTYRNLHTPPEEILAKRNAIKQELLELLEEAKSDVDLDDIEEIIFHEDSTDALREIIAMFDTGQGAVKLQNIMETVNEAWNYFPHNMLDGLSPAEKVLEYKQKGEEG